MFLGDPKLSLVFRACFVVCLVGWWSCAPLVPVVPVVFGIAFFACVLWVFRDCERVRVSQSESE